MGLRPLVDKSPCSVESHCVSPVKVPLGHAGYVKALVSVGRPMVQGRSEGLHEYLSRLLL